MKGKSLLFSNRMKSTSGSISFMPKSRQKSLFAIYIANRHDIDPNGQLDIVAHGSWEEIDLDDTIYQIFVSPVKDININQIKFISELTGLNFLVSKQFLSTGGNLFEGHAVEKY